MFWIFMTNDFFFVAIIVRSFILIWVCFYFFLKKIKNSFYKIQWYLFLCSQNFFNPFIYYYCSEINFLRQKNKTGIPWYSYLYSRNDWKMRKILVIFFFPFRGKARDASNGILKFEILEIRLPHFRNPLKGYVPSGEVIFARFKMTK